MIVIGALVYAVHVIATPTGWAPATPPFFEQGPPRYAAIGAHGSVAILLARTSSLPHNATRLLIVRANGTRLELRVQVPEITRAFSGLKPSECRTDSDRCPYFEHITLARDGTPFITAAYIFSGAYSGVRRIAFVWNGRWRVVPQGRPFTAVGKPDEPTNVSIAAAEGAERFAYVGDYSNRFPQEDLDLAARDRSYMADISGLQFYSKNANLGLGNATAMRGSFIAGFDAGLKLVGAVEDSVAVLWHCAFTRRAFNHPCSRTQLGPGVAYGVDSRGNAVGDNRAVYSTAGAVVSADRSARPSIGLPVLWRSGRPTVLAENTGSAYAISENGTIVGESYVPGPPRTRLSSAFVANAHDRNPVAQPLDLLLRPAEGVHVKTAFGVSDDGRILALVQNKARVQSIAILSPAAL